MFNRYISINPVKCAFNEFCMKNSNKIITEKFKICGENQSLILLETTKNINIII